MDGKWPIRIVAATILIGILVSSKASGSHLSSSSPTSGPPRVHHPQQSQTKQVRPRVQLPGSLSLSRTNLESPSLTKPRSSKQVTEKPRKPAKLHTKLGWRYLLNEQPQAAMAAYHQALKQNPKSANAYLGLGISLKSLGKVGLAKKALLKAVNLNPHLPPALVHLGYLYAEGHFGKANQKMARQLFQEASQLGDPFASIALLEMKSRSKL